MALLLGVDAGAYGASGSAPPAIVTAYFFSSTFPGSYGASGAGLTLMLAATVAAPSVATYGATGSDATLASGAEPSQSIVAAQGSYAASGGSVGLAASGASNSINAAGGSYAASGGSVGLAASGASQFDIAPAQGDYSVTGVGVDLLLLRRRFGGRTAYGIPVPVTLPQVPMVDGYQSSLRSNLVGFQPDVGPAKVRRRGTARSKPQTVSFTYSSEQVAIFEDWFENDLADGSLRMAWADPMRGDLADWQFDKDNPYSFVPYQETLDWVVTWRIERLP